MRVEIEDDEARRLQSDVTCVSVVNVSTFISKAIGTYFHDGTL